MPLARWIAGTSPAMTARIISSYPGAEISIQQKPVAPPPAFSCRFAVLDGLADGQVGGFYIGEKLAIDGEGRELDGEEPVAFGIGHDDALGLAADFDHDGPEPFGPVQTVFLHWWVLHLRVGSSTDAPSLREAASRASDTDSIDSVRRGCDGGSHSFAATGSLPAFGAAISEYYGRTRCMESEGRRCRHRHSFP